MKVFKGFRFDKEMAEQIRKIAEKAGKTQTRILVEALQQYFAGVKP